LSHCVPHLLSFLKEAETPLLFASHRLLRWWLAVSAVGLLRWWLAVSAVGHPIFGSQSQIRLPNHWSSRRGVDKNQGEAAPRKAGREGTIRRPRRELEES